MSKSGFGQMYRKLSSKLLDLIVTPHVLGEVPTEPTATDADPAKKLSVMCFKITHAVMRCWWMVKHVV